MEEDYDAHCPVVPWYVRVRVCVCEKVHTCMRVVVCVCVFARLLGFVHARVFAINKAAVLRRAHKIQHYPAALRRT